MGKLSLIAEDFTRTCHRTFHLMGKVKHLLLTGCSVGRHGLAARVCLIYRTFGLFVARTRRNEEQVVGL
jgi:hypothetical protein